MNLSQKAKKAVAAGLAVSTLMWSAAIFVMPAALAAPHGEGCLVNSGGTVYLVSGGQRRGFTSAEVFASHGYNFGQVVASNSETDALPVGPIIVYAEGSLVKGPSDPLVYLVTNGQKRGFVSGTVFTGLGYSFANIQWAPVNTFNDLPTGSHVESATERHPAGTWVLDGSGTVWMMTSTGRKGLPSMTVFNSYGKSWAHVVAANAADLAAPNEGIVAERTRNCAGGTTPPPSGSVSVSVAGPAASTLIVGQATANLANLVFSGSGTVTSLTLKRTGVSADSTLEDVFLFDGDIRITDSAAVSSGNINFTNSSGLFTVSGSKTISVKADIAGAAGETVGLQLTSVTLSGGSTVGSLPVSANTHTLASATLAAVAWSSPTDSSDVDPGNDILVWQGTASVTTRDVTFTRLALRNIGSINNADIKNFDLLVDGTTVSSQSSLDANGYVTFTLSKTLMAGTRTIKVMADVIGGSSRTVEMSLRGSYDAVFTDSQYGANIESTGTFPFDSDGFTVNAGSISAEKATDSATGNITNNASDVSLGKWKLTAYGEPIKVEVLNVGYTYTDAVGADNAAATLRNARVLINGVQYGSTTTGTAAGVNFTVNYTVNPGSPVTVEYRADVYDNDGAGDGLEDGDDIQPFLNNTGSGLKTVSGGSIAAIPTSDVNANSLNVTVGTITVATTSSYPAQTVVAPASAFKIGSYTITGSSTEDVNLNNFSVDFTADPDADDSSDTFTSADLTNVYLVFGSTTTAPKATVSATGNSYSVTYTLVKNGVLTVDVYATVGSDVSATVAGGNTADDLRSELTVTGTAVSSGTSVAPTEVNGQEMTIGSGTFTTSKDASSPDSKLVDDSGTVEVAKFKMAAANDTYTVTEVDVNVASASAVQNVILKDGSTTLGTKPGATSVLFSGLNITVPANGSKVLTVELQMGTIGVGAGSTGSDVTVTLDSVTNRPSSTGTEATDTTDRAANAMYAYKAVPTITNSTLPTGTLATGTAVLAKFQVSSGGTGTIGWKKFIFTATKTGGTAGDPTVASPQLWDADTNTQITGTGSLVSTDTDGAGADTATNCGETDASCDVVFVATAEQEISGAKTYELRATIGGTPATGENINTNIAQPSSFVAPAAYATVAGTTATFVWSDQGVASHSETTLDWSNGFLVKNLPTNSQTLTK